jgi:hypothetical protein
MLVSCSEEEIGSGIGGYTDVQTTTERLTLNMHIITGDSTTEDSMKNVSLRINSYCKTNYNTDLKITFVKESEYESSLNSALELSDDAAPHIVLINSKSLFDSLMDSEKLADLTDYYGTKSFGQMNVKITPSLLAASKVDNKLYTVPNNRVIGEYEYLVINKIAIHEFKYTNEMLNSFSSYEDAAALVSEMELAGYSAEQIAGLVRVVKGPYELRYEYTDEICNVVSVPTVDAEEAFASSFAVINRALTKFNDRSVEIIYAINNDSELRNLLQYGVEGSNYTRKPKSIDVVRVIDGVNDYEMNLIYTGNVFTAYNCEEMGWTNDSKANGQKQNQDAVVAP